MKNLTDFIQEAINDTVKWDNLSAYEQSKLKKYSNDVPGDVITICEKIMKNVDLAKLEDTHEGDPNRFNISKSNEELFINAFGEDNKYTLIGSSKYYELINPKKKWENLSTEEQAKFDRTNGDIIVMKNDKPIYFIDVKISSVSNFIGSINLGSIKDFTKDGYYLSLNKKTGQYKVLSHASVRKAVFDNDELLNAPIRKNYQGYEITWNTHSHQPKKSSEWFIKGKDLENRFE